jgi:hypothetical protein
MSVCSLVEQHYVDLDIKHQLLCTHKKEAVPFLLRMRPLEEASSRLCQEVLDEVYAMFRCQFAPVIELRQLFAGLFESVSQHSDLLKIISPMLWLWHPLFLNCCAFAWLPNSLVSVLSFCSWMHTLYIYMYMMHVPAKW